MEWNEKYLLGIPEIDREHKLIATCATKIEQAVANAERRSTVHLAVGSLLYTARTHFKLEEVLMRVLRYPDIQAHIQGHEQFIAELKLLEKLALTTALTKQSVEFLHIWLTQHFLSEDKKYATSLSERDRKAITRLYSR